MGPNHSLLCNFWITKYKLGGFDEFHTLHTPIHFGRKTPILAQKINKDFIKRGPVCVYVCGYFINDGFRYKS